MARQTLQTSAFAALKAAIRSGTPERLYFFYGDEVYLLHYYLDALRKKLLDPLTESFNFHQFTQENFSVDALAEAVENLPLMAERTMVWADDVDLFGKQAMTDAQREKLAQVFRSIGDHCTVVFTFETVPWKPGKDSFGQAVKALGHEVEFTRQEQRDLIPWITRHFATRQKRIRPELCAYLIDITGGTMTVLNGEIDKIASYSSAAEICKADIDAVTEPVLDAVVFQMTDLMGAGNFAAALQKLSQLLQMQQEPIVILGAMGSHLRRLGAARTLLENGKSSEDLAKLYGLKAYPARRLMETARKFSAAFCAKAAELVVETDWRMKTSFDQKERLLEQLVLCLAQEAAHA